MNEPLWIRGIDHHCAIDSFVNQIDATPINRTGTGKRACLRDPLKSMLHEIWMSATRDDAIKAFDRFIEVYAAKWPRATECLEKDRAELLAFYDFPAEHWQHLRTSNPIESTFATVRLRTYRTKGPGSREAGLAMAFKLARKAESRWRKLNGSEKLQDLIDGIVFVDGERIAA